MEWYKDLYIGEKAEKYADGIRKRIDAGKSDLGHYIVTLAAHPADHLDLMDTRYLTQDVLRKRLPMIVGIAADEAEAKVLAQQIVEDCLQETGGCDVRSYLLKKQSGA